MFWGRCVCHKQCVLICPNSCPPMQVEGYRNRSFMLKSTSGRISLHKTTGYSGGKVKRLKWIMFETFPLRAAGQLLGYKKKSIKVHYISRWFITANTESCMFIISAHWFKYMIALLAQSLLSQPINMLIAQIKQSSRCKLVGSPEVLLLNFCGQAAFSGNKHANDSECGWTHSWASVTCPIVLPHNICPQLSGYKAGSPIDSITVLKHVTG